MNEMSSDLTSSANARLAKLRYLWFTLLAPWLFIALTAGMAFDAGYTLKAYVFAASVWTYPITVLAATVLRRRWPTLVILPFVNVIAFFISGV